MGERLRPLPPGQLAGIRRQLTRRSFLSNRQARLIFMLDQAIMRQEW